MTLPVNISDREQQKFEEVSSLPAVRVKVVSGGTAGTQYQEGDTAATITGTAVMWEDSGDTLRPISATYPLPVNIVSGSSSGTEYTVDAVAPANPAGGTVVGERDDQLSTLTEAEGDWTNARMSSKGALWVAIADSSGDPITSFGGGTQYTEDAAAAANPVGTAVNLIRADSLAGLTSADGDNVAARGTDKGELYVKHVDAIPVTDNAGSLTIDNAALAVVGGGVEATALRVTIASDSTGVLSVDDNGGSLTVDNADITASAASLAVIDDWDESDRAKVNPIVGSAGVQGGSGAVSASTQRVVLATDVALPAGTNAIGKLAANSGVDIGDVDVTSVIPGTGATNLGKAIDTALGATDTGVLAVGVRDDALATLTEADGDITPARFTSQGRLWASAVIDTALPAGTNNIGDVDVLSVPAPLSTTGGGTEAAALRVTIASDSTGVVSIDDNGGSVTVDNADITTIAGAVYTEAATDATINGIPVLWEDTSDTLRAVSAAKPLPVNIISGASSGTEYTVDAVAPANPTGGTVVAERDDQLATLSEAEGDWTNLRSSAKGALWVTIPDSNGDPITSFGGGTQYNVNDAAPTDPTGPTLVGERDDQLATLSEIEGDWTNARMSSKGALWVTIPDSNGDPITSFGGGTQYTEDAAAAADPVGNALIMVRDDVLSAQTSADGDNIAARGTDKGELYVKHVDAIPVTDNGGALTVDNGGTFAVQATVAAGATNIAKAEDAASADADVGVPAMAVRKATPANTSGTDGDYEMLQMSAGRLWTSATLEATEVHLGEVGGNLKSANAEVTRPADTNAYAAKDAISNSTSSPSVITFNAIARINNGTGYIKGARIITDQVGNTSVFRLHLFNAAPTAINDNAAQTVLYTNKAARIGTVTFDACLTEAGSSDCAYSERTGLNIPFVCTGGVDDLYGLLETVDGFTPASGQKFFIELMAENN